MGKVKVTSYSMVKSQSVPALKAALQAGPVALTIEADQGIF